MAFNIPKIEYGGFIPTVILFDYPPIEKKGESFDSKERVTTSLSGKRQVSVDYIEAKRALSFDFLSESIFADLKAFFLSHAFLGKSFKYFDDKNSSNYVTYELFDLKFNPTIKNGKGANLFVYEVPLTFRRIVGETTSDTMEATINNNQVSALDITGMLLDSSKYKSAKVFFELIRKTDSSERVANGYLTATFKVSTNSWDVTPGGTYDGDTTGVTFSILGTGQIQYTSDNMSGTNYTGKIRFKDFTFE
jgi:hypothetical protein